MKMSMKNEEKRKSATQISEQKNRFLCLPTFFMKLLFAVLGCFAVDVNSKNVYETHLNPQFYD